MNANPRSMIGKTMRWLITLGIAAVILLVAYQYTARPQITITAPTGSSVTIRNLADNVLIQSTTIKTSETFRIATGAYTATITKGNAQRLFYGTAKLFRHSSYTLTNGQGPRTALVTHHIAYGAIQDGNAVDYLDTTNRLFESVTGNTTNILIPPGLSPSAATSDTPYNAQQIHVLAHNKAIVVINSTAYVLHDQQLTPLDTTGFPAAVTSLTIGTNPSQDSFVLAANQSLYWYATADATPIKILALAKIVDQIAFGGSIAVAYSTRMPPAVENIRSNYKGYAIDPIMVNISTKKQHALLTGPIVDASISPDGHYATIENQGASTTTLYNIPASTSAYTIENPDVITPYWLDGTHFIYSKGVTVWKFDTVNHSAAAVGVLSNGLQPTSISYDANSNTYLATTYINDNDAAIYRLTP